VTTEQAETALWDAYLRGVAGVPPEWSTLNGAQKLAVAMGAQDRHRRDTPRPRDEVVAIASGKAAGYAGFVGS
jgi:hypothetical protein